MPVRTILTTFALTLIPSILFARTSPGNQLFVPPGSDCQKINDAIKNIPPSGGTVVLGEGTYTCSAPIVLNRDNVNLVGAGRDEKGNLKTLIKTKASDDKNPIALPVVVIGDTNQVWAECKGPHATKGISECRWGGHYESITKVKNVTLKGLAIDGNKDALSKEVQGNMECYDGKARKAKNCAGDGGEMIRNNGVTVRHASNIHIEDVDSQNNLSGGFTLEKGNDHIYCDHCSASHNFYDGFSCYETRDSEFTNFRNRHGQNPKAPEGFSENNYSGISLDASCDGNKFKNGMMRKNKDDGAFLKATHNTFDNVDSDQNANKAFSIECEHFDSNRKKPCKPHNSCSGNVITNSMITTLTKAQAIFVDENCVDTVVSNTSIKAPIDVPVAKVSDCFKLGGPNSGVDYSNGVTCLNPSTAENVKPAKGAR